MYDDAPTTLMQEELTNEEPVGECMLQSTFLKFYHVSKYRGDDTLSYDSIFVKRAQLSHKGSLLNTHTTVLLTDVYNCIKSGMKGSSNSNLLYF